MKKDAYYFPHFSNARHDRKIKRAMKDLGCEAYAIYFMLLEVLRDQQGFKYPLKDLDLLQDEFGTSLAKIQAVVKGYDLFQIDEDHNFFSMKFNLYLQPYIEKSERARSAANIRWGQLQIECKSNANAYANAEQMQCNGNASKVKESKVKESKVKKEPLPREWMSENLLKTFEDFKKMRKQIKKPLTDAGSELILNKLEKLSDKKIDIAISILEQSIENSWQGIFELKPIHKEDNTEIEHCTGWDNMIELYQKKLQGIHIGKLIEHLKTNDQNGYYEGKGFDWIYKQGLAKAENFKIKEVMQ